MILQELVAYYDRKALHSDPTQRLPALGLEHKDIPFIIELTPAGEAVQLIDTRTVEGKKLRSRSYLVPQGVKKTSGVAANLLWDTAEYALGVDPKNKGGRVAEQHAAFRARITALGAAAQADTGLQAVKLFLRMAPESAEANPAAPGLPDLSTLQAHPQWADFLEANLVVSFQLLGESSLICERPAVVAAALSDSPDESGSRPSDLCLVDGSAQPIERLHTSIKGVWGAQSSGANIVSFNLDAFRSYGKDQGANAPVGERAAFAYTTTLNHLLRSGSRNRVQVGDSSTVFWTDKPSLFDAEFSLADLFAEPPKDDPDRGTRTVEALLSATQTGSLPVSDSDTRVFVLGLAPNAARISVRFWLQAPLPDLAPRILHHFEDLKVARRFDSDPATPSLFRLLSSVALLGQLNNVPPRLAGEWMRAILEDRPYPRVLLNAAVIRCKAEQEVPYLRAAIFKAWHNREHRRTHPELPPDHQHFKEILDMDQPDPAYRLGRLFAVLERIQEVAQPGINATIRDRYYGAASTTPVAVFTTLLRLKNSHLKKLSGGSSIYFERLIGEILAPLGTFPRQLNLPDQGRFALGYYHQRQDFYTRKTATPSDPSTPAQEE